MKSIMADGEYLNWLLSSDDRPIPPPRRRKMERQARLLGAEPAPDNEFPQHVLTGRVGIMKDYAACLLAIAMRPMHWHSCTL
jgi:hypothetical protein